MALAVLCAQLQLSTRHPNLSDTNNAFKASLLCCQFHAFVIDHRVRQGSDVEAIAVSKILERRGTRSSSQS